MHTESKKIICGRTNGALITFKKLARFLKPLRYEMNPHNPYVWNEMVNGVQLTLIFHVNDALMTHILALVVTKHVKMIDEGHGANNLLTINREKVHEHLGMTLDFQTKEQVAFTQHDTTKKF